MSTGLVYVIGPDGKTPVAVSDWTRVASLRSVQVADTTVCGLRVSTVFLGLDHNHSGEGAPVLFETMIWPRPDKLPEKWNGDDADFDAWTDSLSDRYRTWDEAVAGHARVVDCVEWKFNPTAELGKKLVKAAL